MEKLKTYAIILASGSGNRFGSELPKQFCKIENKTLLEWSVEAFNNSDCIDKIILVINEEYKQKASEILSNKYKKLSKIIIGGKTRKDSSFNGVSSIDETQANVLIHDCARPFVSQRLISECVNALNSYLAIGIGINSSDTIVEIENNTIKNIPQRNKLRKIQTPQAFKLSIIKKAHELAKEDNDFTDDCGLVVKYNLAEVFMIEGEEGNIKITYPNDIKIAQILNIQKNKSR